MTVEVFAYGSLATEFGNGYHFIAESDALKRDEKSRAALGTLCNTIGQTGDPGRAVCYATSIRGERGWWVWLRGVPQPDWQGRQGIFLAGVAVRWSDAQARGNEGVPWTIPWSALPFPNFADIKRTLEQAPSGKFREGYFMPPRTVKPPPWPESAAAQLIDERLAALLVGARRLAEGGNYHLSPDPAAEDLVAWLALLQPPATRPGFSYVINAPPRLSWQPRLIFHGATGEAPTGERSPLWGKSPVMPEAGASLAAMLRGRRARGELNTAAFHAASDIVNPDTYWRTLVEQDRRSQLAHHPERIDTTSASGAAGLVRGISTRSKEIPAHALDGLQNPAAIAIGEVKEPADRATARAAWPVLAEENATDLTRRERERAPATQPSPAWIKWALAGTLLLTVLSAATWWWSHQPIPNLAEREARDLSSAREKGRTR